MIIQENINSDCPVSIHRASQLLDVSKGGFYKWEKRLNNEHGFSEKKMDVRNEMQKIAVEFPGYGYRRITVELRNRGYLVNHKRVLWLMREDNLLCVKKKFKPATTDSNHNLKKYPNLIRDLEITRLNQVWASDITYIQLSREFVYLAVILDLFSRRCIGWDLSRNIDTQLTLTALENIALSTVPPTSPPSPKLRDDLPYAIALRDFFDGFKFRAQMNTRYATTDEDETNALHFLDILISRLTSADIQSTITADEAKNVPWHHNSVKAVDLAKEVLVGLDGLKDLEDITSTKLVSYEGDLEEG